MSRPRSINIFLLEGDPDGIRQAQISMSTIQAIAFRKLKLKQVRSTFPELARAGAYLLPGFDEGQPDRPAAYIGESENVADRLQYHAGKDGKTFWIDTIALVSKDENLTKSHARYVEARLIAEAGMNPRWNLVNTQKAAEVGKLPLPDRAAMEEFIDQTKTLVGALGCDLFKAIVGNLAPSTLAESSTDNKKEIVSVDQIFEFRGQGFAAKMSILPSGEYVVLKGSKARIQTTNTIPKGTVALRTDLLSKGILKEDKDAYEFTTDYTFSSVSAAAATVIGASANGRISWRLPDGQTFAEWETAQNEAPYQDEVDADASETD